MIEIKNDHDIIINLDFNFPYNSRDFMYFNNRYDLMLVVTEDHLTFLYKAVKLFGNDSTKVIWDLIRTLSDYDSSLENDRRRLEFFTPCFSKYLALDKKTHEFIIKDTLTGREIKRIPKDYMTFNNEITPSQVLNRFKFIDENTFIIASKDGFEKIIDIDNNFNEIAFNKIPMFDLDEDWKTCHYYL